MDAFHAGTINILAGKYKCTTEILCDKHATKAARQSFNLVGEGHGTFLSFEPSSPLLNAIRLKGNHNRLAHLLVRGNDQVVNLVKGEGPDSSGQGQNNWQVVEHVSLCGPNAGVPTGGASTMPSSPPNTVTPGQIGLFLEGTGNHGTSFFTANWKVTNCEFFALDTAVYLKGQYMDMSNWDNIHIGGCETGFIIEGVQHNLSNIRIEGGGGTVTEGLAPQQGAATVGSKGIWIRLPHNANATPPRILNTTPPMVGGNITFLSNINIELHKKNSHGILIEKSCNNTRMSNIYNSSSDDLTKHTVWDNNRIPGVNMTDTLECAVTRIGASKKRYGTITSGFNKLGTENGILKGNVSNVNNGTANSNLAVTPYQNGPFATLTTNTTLNNVACIYMNTALIVKGQYPTFYVRFWPNAVTGVRIFMGLWDQFTAATSPAAGANILSGRRGIGIYLDTSSGDDNWKIIHNDAATHGTIANFPTKQTGDETYGPNSISAGFINAVTVAYTDANGSNPDVLNGPTANVFHHGLAYDYKTTNVPTTGNFGFLIYIENLTGGTGTSRAIRLFDIELGVTML